MTAFKKQLNIRKHARPKVFL